MLLYHFIRPFARIALRIYFKKIYITNLSLLPKDKPIILAVNHPTAFIEPCILATCLEEDLHFLVRGDFFQKPIFNRLLRSLGMLPVYRMQDGGYQNIKNNYQTFNITHQALNNQEMMMILAEGSCYHEKKLRPIQKGAARMAFGAIDQYGTDLDIHIVPIGVNYSYAERFRSIVMIELAEPIRVLDYLAEYKENKAKAIKSITAELRFRLEQKVIIIDKKEDEEFIERQFQLNRHGKQTEIRPILSQKGSRIKAEKRISQTINTMEETKKGILKNSTLKYFNKLKKIGIEDKGLLQIGLYGIGSFIALIVGFIPFSLGYTLNSPPLLLADYIQKNKVKHIEFQASIAIAVGMVGYLIWWTILLLLAIFSANMNVVFIVLILPALGYFSLLYKEFYFDYKEAKKAGKISNETQEELLKMRREVLV